MLSQTERTISSRFSSSTSGEPVRCPGNGQLFHRQTGLRCGGRCLEQTFLEASNAIMASRSLPQLFFNLVNGFIQSPVSQVIKPGMPAMPLSQHHLCPDPALVCVPVITVPPCFSLLGLCPFEGYCPA